MKSLSQKIKNTEKHDLFNINFDVAVKSQSGKNQKRNLISKKKEIEESKNNSSVIIKKQICVIPRPPLLYGKFLSNSNRSLISEALTKDNSKKLVYIGQNYKKI